MAVTIHDVAREAGVSITTVSHVLSGQGRVAAVTRDRVRKAVADLGFQANIHAQRLARQRSQTLAIQIASFVDSPDSTGLIPNSNYFLEVLNTATMTAAAREFVLVTLAHNTDRALFDRFGIEGVLIIDPFGDEPVFQGHGGPRIVTNGRVAEDRPDIGVVDNDHGEATRRALDHLSAEGYQRPSLVTTDLRRSYTRDIATAYREWCAQRDVEPLVVELDEPPTQEAAAQALASLLDGADQPDAVLAAAEELALGVLHEAQRRGLRVPDDLGVVSAVDSSVLLLTSPTISGTSLNPHMVGRAAIEMLIEAIETDSDRPRVVAIPTEFTVRESSRRRPAAP